MLNWKKVGINSSGERIHLAQTEEHLYFCTAVNDEQVTPEFTENWKVKFDKKNILDHLWLFFNMPDKFGEKDDSADLYLTHIESIPALGNPVTKEIIFMDEAIMIINYLEDDPITDKEEYDRLGLCPKCASPGAWRCMAFICTSCGNLICGC